MENNIVVYRHVRLDTNEVFYIGIGNDKRPYDKRGRNKLWKNIVNKTDYRVDILFDDLSYEEACEKEKEFIQVYGRRDLGLGTLVNMTDGGDGVHNLSDETKKKLSEIRKGLLCGERNGRYGMPVSEETRKKISDALTGKPLSEETKKKLSEVLNGRVFSDETKKKLSESLKGRIFSDEHKNKISNSRKELFINNPNLKDELSIIHKQRYIDNTNLKDEMRQRERQRILDNTLDGKLRPGICKVKNGKFQVQIRIGNDKRLYLGQYITYQEALEVRLKAEDKYWGTNH